MAAGTTAFARLSGLDSKAFAEKNSAEAVISQTQIAAGHELENS